MRQRLGIFAGTEVCKVTDVPEEGLLLFVIPVIAPQRSASWHRTTQLFERTLQSVCAQTSPRFRVVVACHEKPRIDFEHPAVDYLELDYAVPPDDGSAMRLDKKIKIRLALHYARTLGATHSMAVDADDLVSRRLAEFVARRPNAQGWYLETGYFCSARTGSLHIRRGDFFKWTGTSLIVKQGLYQLPADLRAADLFKQEALASTYYVHHSRALDELARRGFSLSPLPFPGATYIIEHGLNLGDVSESMYRPPGLLHRLKRAAFNDRTLSKRIRSEFGFYDLSPS